MSDISYTAEGYPFYGPDGGSPDDGMGALVNGVPNATVNPLMKLARIDNAAPVDAAGNALVARGIIDKLFGLTGPRFRTWPERMVREGVSAPKEAWDTGMMTTRDPYGVETGREPVRDPATGRTSMPTIERVQDLANAAVLGSMPAATRGTLGTSGGRMTQPTIPKVEGPFYSAVENAVTAAPQAKMTRDQWLGWLRNQPGVKKEEIDWLGLEGLPEGALTHDAVVEHVRGHGPQIKEVEKIGDNSVNYRDEYGELIRAQEEGTITPEQYRRIVQLEQMADAPDPTKFSGYQLPGGDNYRELLLTMPETPGPFGNKAYDAANTFRNELHKKYGDGIRNKATSEELLKLDELERRGSQKSGDYRSSHWDEPNVLVHMRMNDRELPGVGKSLHLEEVQSDWHQAGRKKGYASERKQLVDAAVAAEKKWIVADQRYRADPTEANNQAYLKASEEYQAANKRQMDHEAKGASVPDAPFKSTWADLALKRVISKAVREGYDAISWTPGEHQSTNKKNIGHGTQEEQAKNIEAMKAFYDKMLVDKANALAKKFGGKVEWKELPGERPKYFAQEHAGTNLDSYIVYESKIGPEGEDITTALPKAYGSKSEAEAAIKKLDEQYAPLRVPVLRITPAMRDAATGKGFPLFSSGLPFIFTPVDHDPFGPDKVAAIAPDRRAVDRVAPRGYGLKGRSPDDGIVQQPAPDDQSRERTYHPDDVMHSFFNNLKFEEH